MALIYKKDLNGLPSKQEESEQLLIDCLDAIKMIIESDIPTLVKHKTIQEHSRIVVYRAQQLIDNAIAPSLIDPNAIDNEDILQSPYQSKDQHS